MWGVEDVILTAQQGGRPITHNDALSILHNHYRQLGREPGISIEALQTTIEGHSDFDICSYAEGCDGGRSAPFLKGIAYDAVYDI